MKILFYDAKKYDIDSFDKELADYASIEIEYLDADINVRTAALAKGYDAVCAFVSSDLSAPVLEVLHEEGVGLILLRCAGFNNVDLEKAKELGLTVLRVPGYSPEAVAEHAMTLAMSVNRRIHKEYIKVRENNFSLEGLMGINFYGKTAGIIGTGKIGAAMARICRGFGMRVIAYDKYPNPSLDFIEYKELEEVLEGKEYFVVTSNDDGLLYHTHLKKDHVTAPCGNGDFFQCSAPCDEQLYPANLGLRDLIDYYEKTGKIEHLECPKCGKQLIFNVRTEETKSIYIEGAYLNSWASYTKWLQNTLNKKLFILELGEGFEVPSLFRWPFEKMAFYNEKATFVRVHHSLYQIGKEIKEKGIGIKMDSRDFLNIAHE